MIYVFKTFSESSVFDVVDSKNITEINLLEIEIYDFDIKLEFLESIDYLIITSKNAIRAILAHRYKDIFLQKNAILIGEATKQMWVDSKGRVEYCPKIASIGKEIASYMLKNMQIKDKNILYICGEQKASNFKEMLQNHCNIHEITAYKSVENTKLIHIIKQNIDTFFAKNSIFIFGSPKHYSVFMKYFSWDKTWTAISLGKTTFNAFSENIKKINANANFKDAINTALELESNSQIYRRL